MNVKRGFVCGGWGRSMSHENRYSGNSSTLNRFTRETRTLRTPIAYILSPQFSQVVKIQLVAWFATWLAPPFPSLTQARFRDSTSAYLTSPRGLWSNTALYQCLTPCGTFKAVLISLFTPGQCPRMIEFQLRLCFAVYLTDNDGRWTSAFAVDGYTYDREVSQGNIHNWNEEETVWDNGGESSTGFYTRTTGFFWRRGIEGFTTVSAELNYRQHVKLHEPWESDLSLWKVARLGVAYAWGFHEPIKLQRGARGTAAKHMLNYPRWCWAIFFWVHSQC